MSTRPAAAPAAPPQWKLPIDPSRYDRGRWLTSAEQRALAEVVPRMRTGPWLSGRWPAETREALRRLTQPLEDVLDVTAFPPSGRHEERQATRHTILADVHRRQVTFWGWGEDEWLETLQSSPAGIRLHVVAVSYLLTDRRTLQTTFHVFRRRLLAEKLFGQKAVGTAIDRVGAELVAMGFGIKAHWRAGPALSELMLRAASPRLEDLTADLLAGAYSDMGTRLRGGLREVGLALVRLGYLARSPLGTVAPGALRPRRAPAEAPPEWLGWADRWVQTSSLAPKTRMSTYYHLVQAGRWLAARHPEAVSPGAWTRQLAAEWVAAVDGMKVGEWSHAPSTIRYAKHLGMPVSPRTKGAHIWALRTFFQDCHEWEWISRRFDPIRALRVPAHVAAAIGPDPRVIADDVSRGCCVTRSAPSQVSASTAGSGGRRRRHRGGHHPRRPAVLTARGDGGTASVPSPISPGAADSVRACRRRPVGSR